MSAEMDEIWALFVDDGAQAMDAMETALLALQDLSDPAAQAPHIAALFRAVHTFKGNSRVLGLGVIESRAHLAEDLIGLVRDDGAPLDDEIRALLLETGDRLRDMLDAAGASHADVEPESTEDLVTRLREKIAKCQAALAGGSVDDSPASELNIQPEPEPVPAPEPAPEPLAVAEPEPQPQPEAAPMVAPDAASAPADAPPPEAAPVARLADDPAYRRIFTDMVTDALAKLVRARDGGDPAQAEKTLTRVVDDLAHAAGQLGLDDWSGMLQGQSRDADAVAAVVDAIAAMPDFGRAAAAVVQPSGKADFFSAIAAPLSVISHAGIDLSTGEEPDAARLTEAIEAIVLAADADGYVRVSQMAALLGDAPDAVSYRRFELRLYEELAAVEEVIGGVPSETEISPAALLAGWCADHVFDTLDELDHTLNAIRKGLDPVQGQRDLERLVRLIHHACRHYGLDMASQLAMSLLDLFGRGNAQGAGPDAILMRIARGFIDTLELVFDALREGEAPDTERLEQLFQEASEVGFTGAGVLTATAIERKLGLPAAFHRVLSPDSTRAAAEAIAAGRDFHILRADVNDDNDLAEKLFGFIGSGAIAAITNVTVFEGQRTLFDFLIATAMDDLTLSEALANMDPQGKSLVIVQHLTIAGDASDEDDKADKDSQASENASDVALGLQVSSEMLEKIGEIAAGQAMVHSMLSEVVENDLTQSLDAVLRQHSHDPAHARMALRALADDLMNQLRNMAQLETQVLGHMAELQQSTAEMRARPVESVLRPLIAMVATQSRQLGREVRITTAGAGFTLDIGLLDTLKSVLRPLVLGCATTQGADTKRLHLALTRSDDQISVTLDSDGQVPPSDTVLAQIATDLQRSGGQLRRVRLPSGGYRFHLDLPMNLVVIEGMVVGAGGTRYVMPVDAIRTILQPSPESLINIAAGGGQAMLRLSEDEVVAIRGLPQAHGSTASTASDPHRVLVVLGTAGQSVAVPVDDLVGQQLVLLRPLRGVMAGMRNVSGLALLSGGDVGMVLSPRALCATSDQADLVRTPA